MSSLDTHCGIFDFESEKVRVLGQVANLEEKVQVLEEISDDPFNTREFRRVSDDIDRVKALSERLHSGEMQREFEAKVSDTQVRSRRNLLDFGMRIKRSDSNTASEAVISHTDLQTLPKCTLCDLCIECGRAMHIDERSSVAVCLECGVEVSFIQCTQMTTNYSDAVPMDCKRKGYVYDRSNRFREKLTCYQFKEKKLVPVSDIKAVAQHLFSKGVLKSSDVNTNNVRNALKELRMREHYENCPQITYRLRGDTPPYLTPEEEHRCIQMFEQMQEPFEVVSGTLAPSRRNFLHYSYCLFRILHILGKVDSADGFVLLKGVDKMRAMDAMFEPMCKMLGWTFVSMQKLI